MDWGGVGRDGVGLCVGAVPPMQRYVRSKEQWLRYRGGEGHADIERGAEELINLEALCAAPRKRLPTARAKCH